MLSHMDKDARPAMVDVSGKDVTWRTARARTRVRLPQGAAALFRDGELHSAKGPVFQTAILAGTMAVKKTSDLIPLCHPLPIEECSITVEGPVEGRVTILCTVGVHGRTGVEMEALTGASVAALTVYDMCKSLSHDIVIEETRLLEKRGGKSDVNAEEP